MAQFDVGAAPDFAAGAPRFPAAFTSPGPPSFLGFLQAYAPDLVPGRSAVTSGGLPDDLPHATTIVAVVYSGGVVMAGDRRATSGNVIAQRDIKKVFRTDEYSCAGIAGTAGIGVELIRLFCVELEHYEKMEGRELSLEGKANRLSTMIRGNLAMAMQGLIAVPLFAGYDTERGAGRIFSYDAVGGRYEESDFHAIGSGGYFARGSMRKLYRSGMPEEDAVLACMHALYDAAEDDSATGGPDIIRRIYPVVATVSGEGFRELTEEETGRYAQTVVDSRLVDPNGPPAPLR